MSACMHAPPARMHLACMLMHRYCRTCIHCARTRATHMLAHLTCALASHCMLPPPHTSPPAPPHFLAAILTEAARQHLGLHLK